MHFTPPWGKILTNYRISYVPQEAADTGEWAGKEGVWWVGHRQQWSPHCHLLTHSFLQDEAEKQQGETMWKTPMGWHKSLVVNKKNINKWCKGNHSPPPINRPVPSQFLSNSYFERNFLPAAWFYCWVWCCMSLLSPGSAVLPSHPLARLVGKGRVRNRGGLDAVQPQFSDGWNSGVLPALVWSQTQHRTGPCGKSWLHPSQSQHRAWNAIWDILKLALLLNKWRCKCSV